ncbi:MAG TPA: ferritin [Polyangiaceae bacterium]|jgi:hypothetical protein|nr:ferritin [Polyangiaceae bacterium]
MSDYHEPYDLLAPEVRDIHRALVSLKEEIEAIDWYSQRIAVCGQPALGAVLSHARDEEVEHACLMLEWLRTHMPIWDVQLRKRLFSVGSQPVDEAAEPAGAALGAGLGIGKRLPSGA